jgi:hypothetical protein
MGAGDIAGSGKSMSVVTVKKSDTWDYSKMLTEKWKKARYPRGSFARLTLKSMPKPDNSENSLSEFNARMQRLLVLLDDEYKIFADLGGNGCIDGFKPARICPNKDCKDAELDRLWTKTWNEFFPA